MKTEKKLKTWAKNLIDTWSMIYPKKIKNKKALRHREKTFRKLWQLTSSPVIFETPANRLQQRRRLWCDSGKCPYRHVVTQSKGVVVRKSSIRKLPKDYKVRTRSDVVISSHQFPGRHMPLQKSSGGGGILVSLQQSRKILHSRTQAHQLKSHRTQKRNRACVLFFVERIHKCWLLLKTLSSLR